MSNKVIGFIFGLLAMVLVILGEAVGGVMVLIFGLCVGCEEEPLWFGYADNYGLSDKEMRKLCKGIKVVQL